MPNLGGAFALPDLQAFSSECHARVGNCDGDDDDDGDGDDNDDDDRYDDDGKRRWRWP